MWPWQCAGQREEAPGGGSPRSHPTRQQPCLSLPGFTYRAFDECVDFIRHNEDHRILKFHSGILLGLYSSVAIW